MPSLNAPTRTAPTRTVDVDGVRVACTRSGAGPPLVLLHGGVCDGRLWRREAQDLAADFDVVVWDAPGCGRSADPPEGFTLADYAACLAGLLRGLGTGRAHVVGHSWGGGLALQLAVDHPDAVASLVLVGGYAGWGGSLPPDEVDRRLALALELAERLPLDPRAVPGLLSDRMPADRVAELAAVMADVRPAATRAMARAFAAADLRPHLSGVDVPVLLLWGAADERSPRAVAERLHHALPRSTLAVVPALGHELVLEAPALFTTAVRAFVGGQSTSRP